VKPIRYHILLALAGGPLHGAEIRRRAEEESGGVVTLYPAMLYGALDELSEMGFIQEVEKEDPSPEQVRWRFYSLSPRGRVALEEETGRLEEVLRRARSALGAVPEGGR
jgi:DNA-binding PadR family transcriptional regulator